MITANIPPTATTTIEVVEAVRRSKVSNSNAAYVPVVLNNPKVSPEAAIEIGHLLGLNLRAPEPSDATWEVVRLGATEHPKMALSTSAADRAVFCHHLKSFYETAALPFVTIWFGCNAAEVARGEQLRLGAPAAQPLNAQPLAFHVYHVQTDSHAGHLAQTLSNSVWARAVASQRQRNQVRSGVFPALNQVGQPVLNNGVNYDGGACILYCNYDQVAEYVMGVGQILDTLRERNPDFAIGHYTGRSALMHVNDSDLLRFCDRPDRTVIGVYDVPITSALTLRAARGSIGCPVVEPSKCGSVCVREVDGDLEMLVYDDQHMGTVERIYTHADSEAWLSKAGNGVGSDGNGPCLNRARPEAFGHVKVVKDTISYQPYNPPPIECPEFVGLYPLGTISTVGVVPNAYIPAAVSSVLRNTMGAYENSAATYDVDKLRSTLRLAMQLAPLSAEKEYAEAIRKINGCGGVGVEQAFPDQLIEAFANEMVTRAKVINRLRAVSCWLYTTYAQWFFGINCSPENLRNALSGLPVLHPVRLFFPADRVYLPTVRAQPLSVSYWRTATATAFFGALLWYLGRQTSKMFAVHPLAQSFLGDGLKVLVDAAEGLRPSAAALCNLIADKVPALCGAVVRGIVGYVGRLAAHYARRHPAVRRRLGKLLGVEPLATIDGPIPPPRINTMLVQPPVLFGLDFVADKRNTIAPGIAAVEPGAQDLVVAKACTLGALQPAEMKQAALQLCVEGKTVRVSLGVGEGILVTDYTNSWWGPMPTGGAHACHDAARKNLLDFAQAAAHGLFGDGGAILCIGCGDPNSALWLTEAIARWPQCYFLLVDPLVKPDTRLPDTVRVLVGKRFEKCNLPFSHKPVLFDIDVYHTAFAALIAEVGPLRTVFVHSDVYCGAADETNAWVSRNALRNIPGCYKVFPAATAFPEDCSYCRWRPFSWADSVECMAWFNFAGENNIVRPAPADLVVGPSCACCDCAFADKLTNGNFRRFRVLPIVHAPLDVHLPQWNCLLETVREIPNCVRAGGANECVLTFSGEFPVREERTAPLKALACAASHWAQAVAAKTRLPLRLVIVRGPSGTTKTSSLLSLLPCDSFVICGTKKACEIWRNAGFQNVETWEVAAKEAKRVFHTVVFDEYGHIPEPMAKTLVYMHTRKAASRSAWFVGDERQSGPHWMYSFLDGIETITMRTQRRYSGRLLKAVAQMTGVNLIDAAGVDTRCVAVIVPDSTCPRELAIPEGYMRFCFHQAGSCEAVPTIGTQQGGSFDNVALELFANQRGVLTVTLPQPRSCPGGLYIPELYTAFTRARKNLLVFMTSAQRDALKKDDVMYSAFDEEINLKAYASNLGRFAAAQSFVFASATISSCLNTFALVDRVVCTASFLLGAVQRAGVVLGAVACRGPKPVAAAVLRTLSEPEVLAALREVYPGPMQKAESVARACLTNKDGVSRCSPAQPLLEKCIEACAALPQAARATKELACHYAALLGVFATTRRCGAVDDLLGWLLEWPRTKAACSRVQLAFKVHRLFSPGPYGALTRLIRRRIYQALLERPVRVWRKSCHLVRACSALVKFLQTDIPCNNLAQSTVFAPIAASGHLTSLLTAFTSPGSRLLTSFTPMWLAVFGVEVVCTFIRVRTRSWLKEKGWRVPRWLTRATTLVNAGYFAWAAATFTREQTKLLKASGYWGGDVLSTLTRIAAARDRDPVASVTAGLVSMAFLALASVGAEEAIKWLAIAADGPLGVLLDELLFRMACLESRRAIGMPFRARSALHSLATSGIELAPLNSFLQHASNNLLTAAGSGAAASSWNVLLNVAVFGGTRACFDCAADLVTRAVVNSTLPPGMRWLNPAAEDAGQPDFQVVDGVQHALTTDQWHRPLVSGLLNIRDSLVAQRRWNTGACAGGSASLQSWLWTASAGVIVKSREAFDAAGNIVSKELRANVSGILDNFLVPQGAFGLGMACLAVVAANKLLTETRLTRELVEAVEVVVVAAHPPKREATPGEFRLAHGAPAVADERSFGNAGGYCIDPTGVRETIGNFVMLPVSTSQTAAIHRASSMPFLTAFTVMDRFRGVTVTERIAADPTAVAQLEPIFSQAVARANLLWDLERLRVTSEAGLEAASSGLCSFWLRQHEKDPALAAFAGDFWLEQYGILQTVGKTQMKLKEAGAMQTVNSPACGPIRALFDLPLCARVEFLLANCLRDGFACTAIAGTTLDEERVIRPLLRKLRERRVLNLDTTKMDANHFEMLYTHFVAPWLNYAGARCGQPGIGDQFAAMIIKAIAAWRTGHMAGACFFRFVVAFLLWSGARFTLLANTIMVIAQNFCATEVETQLLASRGSTLAEALALVNSAVYYVPDMCKLIDDVVGFDAGLFQGDDSSITCTTAIFCPRGPFLRCTGLLLKPEPTFGKFVFCNQIFADFGGEQAAQSYPMLPRLCAKVLYRVYPVHGKHQSIEQMQQAVADLIPQEPGRVAECIAANAQWYKSEESSMQICYEFLATFSQASTRVVAQQCSNVKVLDPIFFQV